MKDFLLDERRRPAQSSPREKERELGSQDDFESYLVDRNGNAYEPYSLAWRYLGMYIDCDVSESSDGRRRLEDENSCDRKILWAAYHDPRYQGGSIGEYQFYNWVDDTWDASTCKTQRCARLDCHEANTHFKLVGVFKEIDGLVDWAEQLFKHEGICAWNDDSTYSFMQLYREGWPSQCRKMSIPDSNGDTLYLHTRPQGEGNMTYEIYGDEKCTQPSETTSFSDYVVMYYNKYYYYYTNGESAAKQWNATFQLWNEYMTIYKICQPCRAYSLNRNDNADQKEHFRRQLGGDENDGEGDEEQWGYNCYDDAGYTNCNQCYKFETKTDLEPATTADLVRASKQGTILAIKVNGRVYGQGGFHSEVETGKAFLMITSVGLVAGGILFLILILCGRCLWSRFKRELPPSFQAQLVLQNESAEIS